jgi:hypothetical protein
LGVELGKERTLACLIITCDYEPRQQLPAYQCLCLIPLCVCVRLPVCAPKLPENLHIRTFDPLPKRRCACFERAGSRDQRSKSKQLRAERRGQTIESRDNQGVCNTVSICSLPPVAWWIHTCTSHPNSKGWVRHLCR